jgi:hypothetical protein
MTYFWPIVLLSGRICRLLCKEEQCKKLKGSVARMDRDRHHGADWSGRLPGPAVWCRSGRKCLGGPQGMEATLVPLHSPIRAHMIDDPLDPENRSLGLNQRQTRGDSVSEK